MKIDNTSMFKNASIHGATATAAWATAVGQSKTNQYRFNTILPGLDSFIFGMNYKIYNPKENEKLDISKGSKNRELLYFSIFDKIYVNGLAVPDTKFIILLIKEHSKSHDGRIHISYPDYAKLLESERVLISNHYAMVEMAKVLNCENGCWFVHDISVKNQDELHFNAIVVDNSPRIYADSAERKTEWERLVKKSRVEEFSITQIEIGRNLIYFGPPGTGKSHRANEEIDRLGADSTKILFHPDYTYGDFFGNYKPVVGSDLSSMNFKNLEGQEGLSMPVNYFEFIAGPFMKAIVNSLLYPSRPHYLLIDEINRGDCSAIFGDLFQLLDRDSDGSSKYSVELRPEAVKWLDGKVYNWGQENNGQLKIPKNLTILGTMNTSDQNLYPMDTAFKRRWEWSSCSVENEYYNLPAETYLKIREQEYNWIQLIKNLNNFITSRSNGMEDKQIGPWFIKPAATDNSINVDSFSNKLLFYLWHDVFKDDQDAESCPLLCFDEKGNEINTFGMLQSLFTQKGLEAIFKPEILLGCRSKSSDAGTFAEDVDTSNENLAESSSTDESEEVAKDLDDSNE